MPLKVDRIIIDKLIEDEYVMVNRHPYFPLRILNYSRKTQFEKYWNEMTLLCRGLIIDDDYNVVAWGFPKFFNYEQHAPEEIPNLPFEAFEKMDGSLGIAFRYEGDWIVATRGSFESEQAIKAKELLLKYFERMNINVAWNIYSREEILLVEIIYPENRIVCDYGDVEKLVLLAVYNRNTGEELAYNDWSKYYSDYGFEVVKRYDGLNDIQALREMNEINREGFIIRFSNGMRVKIKFADYCRLHSIITNVSTKDIWEFLRDGKDFDELLERVPDEFDSWVREQQEKILNEYHAITFAAHKEYASIVNSFDRDFSKKDFALKALQSEHHALLFNIYSGKDLSKTIWRMIEPEYSKPFWNKTIDEE